MIILPSQSVFLVFFCLYFSKNHCSCLEVFLSTYDVIESEVATETQIHVVSDVNPPIKLRCHDPKSKTDDMVWEYKSCGYGMSLTACEDLPKNAQWHFALCRNHTKLCVGAILLISDPAESDSGLYRCLHKNYMMRKYHINRTIRLEIEDFRTKSIEILPEASEIDNQVVMENQTAVLRCRVRSVAYPYIGWVRSGYGNLPMGEPTVSIAGVVYQFLNRTETHYGPDKLYTSKLYIPRTDLSDTGTYICVALGARHNVSKQVSLTVVPAILEVSSTRHEAWWIAIAMVISATSCVLVLCFLIQRNRPEKVAVPSEGVLEDCESSSLRHLRFASPPSN